MAYGSMTLADLQATRNASTVADVGLDVTFEAIRMTLDAHNRIMREMVEGFAAPTTEESFRYGGDDSMTMEDADELTVPRAQKIAAGSTVGFPLNATMIGHQWSEMWFRKHTIEEMAALVNSRLRADRVRVTRDLKRAIYYAANYTHRDHLARNVDLAVKRLANADSAPIPPGPNGESFDAATHTHYLARVGALAASDYTAAINTVKEHFETGEIILAINSADEAALRAFTSNFTAYPDPRLTFSVNTTRTISGSLDPVNLYNRAIGIFDGVEVHVKPWAISGYPIVYNASAGKVLAYRYDPDYGDGLQLVYDEDRYPWHAQAFRRIFGFGVRNRIAAAVLYVGGTSYTNPTIT
jgi:hypothetical protein